MINIRDGKSAFYRIGIPVLQVINIILLMLFIIFDDSIVIVSDISIRASLILQLIILSLLGSKELLAKNNKIGGYISYAIIITGAIIIWMLIK